MHITPTNTRPSVLGKRNAMGAPQVAGGVCLLVILLSFGFYFNFTNPSPVFDSRVQGRSSGVTTGRYLLQDEFSTESTFSLASFQRWLFAWRYGSKQQVHVPEDYNTPDYRSACEGDSCKDSVCLTRGEYEVLVKDSRACEHLRR